MSASNDNTSNLAEHGPLTAMRCPNCTHQLRRVPPAELDVWPWRGIVVWQCDACNLERAATSNPLAPTSGKGHP